MKIYITPNIRIVTRSARYTLLAGSANTNASSIGLSSSTADNGSAYSRGFDYFDDEDED